MQLIATTNHSSILFRGLELLRHLRRAWHSFLTVRRVHKAEKEISDGKFVTASSLKDLI